MTRRNYRREHALYYGTNRRRLTPKQRLHRRQKVSRNAARAYLRKRGINVSRRDVDHRNGNPLDNRLNNLRIMPIRSNRSRNRRRRRK